ncbi:glycosyltransferase family 2 protein [Sphingobacterium anhuiense]|uniref:glycosyltransferase family 2 protein n=1 Tax=Sphingobacterium anhuiense TaxID=493780 RepID=UPI003C2CFA13
MEISVVIPHYNSSELLLLALQSVSRQTYLPKEVIIVDDCSNPSHIVSLNHMATLNFPFSLTIYYSDYNQGAPAARNRGVRESTYSYIAFLDSDDCWLDDKLALQKQAIGNFDFLYGNYKSFINSINFQRDLIEAYPVDYLHILRKNLSPVTLLLKKCSFIPFDERLRRCDDFKMSIEALSKGRRIGFVDLDLAHGFKNSIGGGGLTGSLLKMSSSFIKACFILIYEQPRLSFYMIIFIFFEMVKFPIRCLKVFLRK